MLHIRILIVPLLYLSSAICATSTDESTIGVLLPIEARSGPTIKKFEETKDVPTVPKIYDMKVVSKIANRIATTQIITKMKNLGESTQQAKFFVILPEAAYISEFAMDVNGKGKRPAYVSTNKEAKQVTHPNMGTVGARVETNANDSNNFTVVVNIDRRTEATIYLTYEELLVRKQDQYELAVNVYPGQPVENLSLEVYIQETRRIKFFSPVPFLSSGDQNNSTRRDKIRVQALNTSASVVFNPDLDDQKAFARGKDVVGQLVVRYDVERDPLKGEVLTSFDGYFTHFVHFFAPSDVPPLKKHVVFVIDTSNESKREQLETAMKLFLDELKKGDTFNILQLDFNNWNITLKRREQFQPHYLILPYDEFGTTVDEDVYVTDAFEVNEQNIKNAKEIIDDYLYSDPNPNLEIGLIHVLHLVEQAKNKTNNPNQPIIVFVTGGQALMSNEALAEFTKSNRGTAPVFTLSFGDGVFRKFLRKFSRDNQGFDRHIDDDEDVSSRAKMFYRQISTALLNNDHFKYLNATNVTKEMSPVWLEGSELVVAGKYHGDKAPFDKQSEVVTRVRSLEKFAAYLSLKQLLDERSSTCDKENYTKRALEIARAHYFVTPLSSLIVNDFDNDIDDGFWGIKGL